MIDWYNCDELKTLNEKHSKQCIQLYKKMKDARDKGDEKALSKARESMRKHQAKGQEFKQKSEDAGYCWV